MILHLFIACRAVADVIICLDRLLYDRSFCNSYFVAAKDNFWTGCGYNGVGESCLGFS